MTTVAEVLKQERETQGISLEEVAQKTYIKLHYLHALEEDRPDLLPAPVYTCGYIRQYAKLLGLNGADLVNIYQSQHKPREYAIVRNVSPALAPETKVEPRPAEPRADEAAPADVVPTMVRHEAPVLERPISASAAAPVAPSPAPVAPSPAPAGNGSASPANRPRHEATTPAPTLTAPTPAPRVQAAPAPVAPPSRPTAPAVAEAAPQPMEVRIDTRDAASNPEAEKILMLARQQADEIIAKAREEAARLRQGAEQYADQILSQLETDISRTLSVIKNGRSHLQTRQRARRTPERVSERTPEPSSI